MQCGQSVQLLNVKPVGASRDQHALKVKNKQYSKKNVMSNKRVEVSKHRSMEQFSINSNAFRYLKITETKFSHVRHSTWIQTVHFRDMLSVCQPA
jgi:hypothetical protein